MQPDNLDGPRYTTTELGPRISEAKTVSAPDAQSSLDWEAVSRVLARALYASYGTCPADEKYTWNYIESGPLSRSYCDDYCESKGDECWLQWAIMEANKCQSSG